MKAPRPLSILYGSSLRVCTCRRGAQDVRHVFLGAARADGDARRTRAAFMKKECRQVCLFHFRSLPPRHTHTHNGWLKTILADDRLAHAVRAVQVVHAKDARPPQVHRRILDVHRAFGRVPIRILRSRHQLSFQCLSSRVRRRRRLRSLAHWECRFSSSVGQFVLTASLRAQVNPENRAEFKEVSPERCVLPLVSPSRMVNAHVQSVCRFRTGVHRAPLFRIQLSRMNHVDIIHDDCQVRNV